MLAIWMFLLFSELTENVSCDFDGSTICGYDITADKAGYKWRKISGQSRSKASPSRNHTLGEEANGDVLF